MPLLSAWKNGSEWSDHIFGTTKRVEFIQDTLNSAAQQVMPFSPYAVDRLRQRRVGCSYHQGHTVVELSASEVISPPLRLEAIHR